MDRHAKERLNMVREQPVPSQRRSFGIDFNGWLPVDLLPTGRRLWVVQFQDRNKKRRQVTLGDLSATSYRQGFLTAKDVSEAARQGDKIAKLIVNRTGKRLGQALAILVDLLNPERIVIGRLAMRMGESPLGPARKSMQEKALCASAKDCEIVPAALGEQIGEVDQLEASYLVLLVPVSREGDVSIQIRRQGQ